MPERLQRSIKLPIRVGLNWTERWAGLDEGLIFCWEQGRELRFDNPDLAVRAEAGELVPLEWKGGVEKKLKANKPKAGSFFYLATWQGLRGQSLDIDIENETIVVCPQDRSGVTCSQELVHGCCCCAW